MAGYIPRWYTRPKTVTHPGSNRARRALTSFMRRTPLTTTPRRQPTGCILRFALHGNAAQRAAADAVVRFSATRGCRELIVENRNCYQYAKFRSGRFLAYDAVVIYKNIHFQISSRQLRTPGRHCVHASYNQAFIQEITGGRVKAGSRESRAGKASMG